MNITEDYVSFETAKLLKEKGFDEPCIGFYNPIDGCFFEASIRRSWDYNRHGSVNAPTLQMVMKWLREVYNINLNIIWNPTFKDYFVELFKPTLLYSTTTYQSYEEACEAAIKYSLENLI